MHASPQKEHEWLQTLVGDWAVETEMLTEPGKPPMKVTSTESVRSLGGLWVQCEGVIDGPDGTKAVNIMTLGYDPAKKRYVGTFVSSMMTHLWIYDGDVESSGKVLILDAEGPGFTPDVRTAKYQDSIEIVNKDHRILRSQMLQTDGTWFPFMTANYHRTK